MSAVFKRGTAQMHANLTPMIDVTFLLIVFFVAVSQIVQVENVNMDLPQPDHALTIEPGEDERIIINVVPDPDDLGNIIEYRVGTLSFPPTAEGVDGMINYLIGRYKQQPDIDINLRADRTTHYEYVEPAMSAVTIAASRSGEVEQVARMNLVVLNKND
ncbi:MAG: ExbD/TolR family protein [Phycisphaerales bacterium]